MILLFGHHGLESATNRPSKSRPWGLFKNRAARLIKKGRVVYIFTPGPFKYQDGPQPESREVHVYYIRKKLYAIKDLKCDILSNMIIQEWWYSQKPNRIAVRTPA